MTTGSKKSTPSNAAGSRPFPWATVILLSLLSAGGGSLLTWTLLSGNSQRPAPTTNAAPSATPAMLQDALSLGNWYYDHQQWTSAIGAYEQAISQGSDNPDVRTDLGNCYRFTGEPQKALEQYQIAQQQNPQHENSLLNQASLYSQVLHDHAKAEAIAREFLQRFPGSVSADAARQLLMPTAPQPAP